MIASFFRYRHGVLPDVLALSYTLLGYALGVWLLFAGHWGLNLAGVLLTGHSLVYSAYFVHEFAHQSIYRSPEANHFFGTLMTWINGSCYAPFGTLRRKHMRHHLDRADIVTFDHNGFLDRSPGWFRGLVLLAEWCYVPAIELIMHAHVLVVPFARADSERRRLRVLAVAGVRATLFALMAFYSLKALLLYAIAYMLMLHALRFADAYQHTYDAVAVLEEGEVSDGKVRDREYEQANTYSNLISVAHPWLNLLLLNFAYHNAHHERPIVPWHDLPKLHSELFPSGYPQVIPMRTLLRGYHRDRITRVLAENYGEVKPGRVDGFIGAVGVSFLTTV